MHGQHEALRRWRGAKSLAISGALGMTLATPGLALAQGWMPQEWYAGAGAGWSALNDENEALLGNDFDDEDTGWKVFAGFDLRYFGVEVAYLDFGEFTGTGPGVRSEWEATGWNVSALGVLPFPNPFGLFAKVGATRWDVDRDETVAGVAASETGTDLSYGIGAEWDFTQNTSARLEWERFEDVGDENITGRSDLDLVSVSVVFRY